MRIERDIINEFSSWKDSPNRKPILLKGPVRLAKRGQWKHSVESVSNIMLSLILTGSQNLNLLFKRLRTLSVL